MPARFQAPSVSNRCDRAGVRERAFRQRRDAANIAYRHLLESSQASPRRMVECWTACLQQAQNPSFVDTMKSTTSQDERAADRRTFLKTAGAMAAGLLAESGSAAAAPTPPAAPPMPTRNFGKTGYKVGIYSLGGKLRSKSPTTKPWPCRLSSGCWTWV